MSIAKFPDHTVVITLEKGDGTFAISRFSAAVNFLFSPDRTL